MRNDNEILVAGNSNDTLLDVTAVAKKFNISTRSVWRLVASGEIPPPIRIGRCARWFPEGAKQPMEKHLTDFLDDLRSVSRDEVYIENLGYLIRILIRECGWLNPPKVTADSFQGWRSRQKKASKTLNQYLDCANAMLN